MKLLLRLRQQSFFFSLKFLVKIRKVKDEIFTYPQHPLQTGIILSNEITESDYRFKIKMF